MANQADRIVEAAVAAIVTAASDPEILVLSVSCIHRIRGSGHYAFPVVARILKMAIFVTCLRETREECGISLSSECLVKKYPVQYAGNHLNRPVPVTTYLFEIPRKPIIVLERSEITCYEWMPLSLYCRSGQSCASAHEPHRAATAFSGYSRHRRAYLGIYLWCVDGTFGRPLRWYD